MAYTKQTWTSGETVTSAKLNHMEDGIAGSENVFIVGASLDSEGSFTGALDKTWQQIRDAMKSKSCLIIAENGDKVAHDIIASAVDNPEPVEEGDKRYQILTCGGFIFTTDTKNGYPA